MIYSFPYPQGKIYFSVKQPNGDLMVSYNRDGSDKQTLANYSSIDWSLVEFLTRQGTPPDSLAQLQNHPGYMPGEYNPFRVAYLENTYGNAPKDEVLSSEVESDLPEPVIPPATVDNISPVTPYTHEPVQTITNTTSATPATMNEIPTVNVQTEQREGNDLVIYYPNGTIDRFKNYYSPTSVLEQIKTGEKQYTPKAIVTDERIGDDRLVRFTDGTQKVFRNYYLPAVVDITKLNAGSYPFGTDYDPEYLAFKGEIASNAWLIDDYRSVNDRVLKYSDGTSKTLADWYIQNAGYASATAGIPVNTPNFSDVSKAPLPQSKLYIPDPRNNVPPVPPVILPGASGQPVGVIPLTSSFANPVPVPIPLTSVSNGGVPLSNNTAPPATFVGPVVTNPPVQETILDAIAKNPIGLLSLGLLAAKLFT